MTAQLPFPPEPWRLVGQLHTSVFLIDSESAKFPPDGLPPGWRLLRIGRRSVVGTAWVSYETGSVLEYSELMSVVLVRHGWRILPSITHIWVDSEASRAGGRALWGIPKELARFEFDGELREATEATDATEATEATDATEVATVDSPALAPTTVIARGTVRARRDGSWRVPVRFRVVQLRGGAAKVTPVRAIARLSLDDAEFHATPRGRLGFLAGRRPLINLSLNDFEMTFGGRRRDV